MMSGMGFCDLFAVIYSYFFLTQRRKGAKKGAESSVANYTSRKLSWEYVTH
jgi:hypothetical protein